MNVSSEIKNVILSSAIKLDSFGVNGLAWEALEAIRLIHFLNDKSIGLLGGNAYAINDEGLNPLCDNWACDPAINEPETHFFVRSKKQALDYLKAYPIPLDKKIVFEIVFTESIIQHENKQIIADYGKISVENCMDFIVWCFPEFKPHWDKHIQFWDEQPRSLEIDFCEFANFAISFETVLPKVADFVYFTCFLLLTGDEKVKDACNSGFISMMTDSSSFSSLFKQTNADNIHFVMCSELPLPARLFIWTTLESLRRSCSKVPANISNVLLFYENSLNQKVSKEINENNCALFLLKKIPGFFEYWYEQRNPWYFMIPLNLFPTVMQYAIQSIENNEPAKIKQICSILEDVRASGSQLIQNEISEYLIYLHKLKVQQSIK